MWRTYCSSLATCCANQTLFPALIDGRGATLSRTSLATAHLMANLQKEQDRRYGGPFTLNIASWWATLDSNQ